MALPGPAYAYAMPTPRSQSVPRGTRIRGDRPVEPPRRRTVRPRVAVAEPARPREVIDHGLAKRAVLAAMAAGGAFLADLREEYLEADPYLLRAAKHHGEQTERPCPVCAKGSLRHVTYVFGDDLGEYSGRVKSSADLVQMAFEYGEFRVYVVEVCGDCGWNHVHISYTLGDGRPS